MNNTKTISHTPGPWKLEPVPGHPTDDGIYTADGKEWIARANKNDARLIAAAPELLVACLECEVLVGEYLHITRMVKEAVAKALGENIKQWEGG
jgi:hypothetical protein